MKNLKINYHFDETLTQELSKEVNRYLKKAHSREICSHIKGFYFFDSSVKKTFREDYKAIYEITDTDRINYFDMVIVCFEDGILKSINFETWRTDWDGEIKSIYGFSDGARILSTCRGLSVSDGREDFYECEEGRFRVLE